MEFKDYVRTPDVAIFKGFRVTKETEIDYKSKNGKQKIKNLIYTKWDKQETDDYTTETKITVPLKEGTLILFQGEEEGYVVPAEQFKTIDEAIEDFNAVKED